MQEVTVSTKKKWKIVGMDQALAGLPPEDRPEVAAEIQELFQDFDPQNPPGDRVLPVEPGTRICPRCGGTLLALCIEPGREESEYLRILECEDCDAPFSEPLH